MAKSPTKNIFFCKYLEECHSGKKPRTTLLQILLQIQALFLSYFKSILDPDVTFSNRGPLIYKWVKKQVEVITEDMFKILQNFITANKPLQLYIYLLN